MKLISRAMGAATAGLLSWVAPAHAATTLDFDALRNKSSTSYTYVTGPYKEDGFTLTASNCQGRDKSGCFAAVQPYKSMDKVGASLFTQFVSPTVTVKSDDGAAFVFQSIDFSEYFDNGAYNPFSTNVNFSFVFQDGTLGTAARTFSTAGKFLPTTFAFDLAPVTSVSWTPVTGSGVQFDNIVLGAVAAVPEPATWAMMLMGFGMIGGAARRRGKTVATRSA
ncbi:PEPxxWA-CTERM sorting domain-containing protein [Sphingomonas qilianensis]|uniref:PEPxxWA-CTERM sorting domain-containing protein n=1 Tax=Sphingomonas qilianensis TaxID=1736690 RepID=A0ABU9XRC2_9SPHN